MIVQYVHCERVRRAEVEFKAAAAGARQAVPARDIAGQRRRRRTRNGQRRQT